MMEQMNNQVNHKGSKDGTGSGDIDKEYRFGRKPTAEAPFPFTTRQYAKELVLRGKVWAQAETGDHPNLSKFINNANPKK